MNKLGKPAERKKCLRCNEWFWSKPKKVFTIVNGKREKHYETEDYCPKCNKLKNAYEQKDNNDRLRIRVLDKNVNVRREVEMLHKLEHYNPALLDKLRKGIK